MHRRFPLVFLIFALGLRAQDKADAPGVLTQVLQRLDALEKQNRELMLEVHALRQELSASKAPAQTAQPESPPAAATLDERVTVDEHRIEEQAQTKIEASQKFPIQLNGMLLFNAFTNSGDRNGHSLDYPFLAGPDRSGATLRQTLLGLKFQGPRLPGDGHVNGSLLMDFWGGYSEPGLSWLRLREAEVSLDWANRSFSVGQQKPLISPYQPSSLAEVSISPLAGAGNLWLWLPQARYEERVHLGRNSGIRGQIALMQTDETYANVPAEYSSSLDRARPAVEGRAAFWHSFDDVRRFELGAGFHAGTTHVAGNSVDSRIASADWLFVTGSRLAISGTFFHGQNVAGLGALGNAFTLSDYTNARPVHSSGGWTQFAFTLTNRMTLNVFGGLQDDRSQFLSPSSFARNFTYAANLQYHLGPNVVVGLEGLQTRSRMQSGVNGIHNHYDLAIGYLF